MCQQLRCWLFCRRVYRFIWHHACLATPAPPRLPRHACSTTPAPHRLPRHVCLTGFPPLALAPPAAASLGDTATPLGKAVRILNNQLQALTQVGGRCCSQSQAVVEASLSLPRWAARHCQQLLHITPRLHHNAHPQPLNFCSPCRWTPASTSCPDVWQSWATPADRRRAQGLRSAAAADILGCVMPSHCTVTGNATPGNLLLVPQLPLVRRWAVRLPEVRSGRRDEACAAAASRSRRPHTGWRRLQARPFQTATQSDRLDTMAQRAAALWGPACPSPCSTSYRSSSASSSQRCRRLAVRCSGAGAAARASASPHFWAAGRRL